MATLQEHEASPPEVPPVGSVDWAPGEYNPYREGPETRGDSTRSATPRA